MSVKAMSLVWDLECPKGYGEVVFKPSHKYVLIAYADHADHNGKNIYPAVPTIAKKTGLDDRTIQRLTNDLETIGLLIDDGVGPRGTNRWSMPFSDGGDKLTPRQFDGGDKSKKSLGDIPSGDIPSGDKLTPEFKEPEPIKENDYWMTLLEVIENDKEIQHSFKGRTQETRVINFNQEDGTLFVGVSTQDDRDWLDDRFRKTAERMLVGIMNREVSVKFVIQAKELA